LRLVLGERLSLPIFTGKYNVNGLFWLLIAVSEMIIEDMAARARRLLSGDGYRLHDRQCIQAVPIGI
jgi:hypothetical protein